MNLLRSLRVQLALIIVLVMIFPVSIIGYNTILYEMAEKNIAANAQQQLASAAEDLLPLFNDVSSNVKVNELRDLSLPVGSVLRYYPGVKVSYYSNGLIYTFFGKGLGKSQADNLLISSPTSTELNAFQTVQRDKPEAATCLIEGSWPGQTTLKSVFPSGRNKTGLVILQSRLSQFFLENNSTREQILASLILGMLIGIFGIVWISYRLQRGIAQIRSGLAQSADDLTIPLSAQSGELGLVVNAINDMREELAQKQKLEEQLQRTERLAGLGKLVAGVAHEIRNPLGIVKGTVQLMQREMAKEQELNRFQEHFKVLEEQINRQNRVVEELLSYARPVKPQFGPVNVDNVVNSVLAFLSPSLRQQGIQLCLDVKPGLPPIMGDGEKLKQVFVNLLLNSKEALPKGGQIEITVSADPQWLRVRFADNGQGINPGDLQLVFEPFYSTKDAGTGLGLSIAKQLVEQHKGKLQVKSEIGRGTEFIVYIPVGGENLAQDSGSG